MLTITHRTADRVCGVCPVSGGFTLTRLSGSEYANAPWLLVTSDIRFATAEDGLAALERMTPEKPQPTPRRTVRYCNLCRCRINYGVMCGKCEFARV